MQGSRHMCLRQSERQKRGEGIRGSENRAYESPQGCGKTWGHEQR